MPLSYNTTHGKKFIKYRVQTSVAFVDAVVHDDGVGFATTPSHELKYYLQYPISVGKTWQDATIPWILTKFAPTLQIPVTATITHVGKRVTTPAGTFEDCLVVEYVGSARATVHEDITPGVSVPVTFTLSHRHVRVLAANVGLISYEVTEELTKGGRKIPVTKKLELVSYKEEVKVPQK